MVGGNVGNNRPVRTRELAAHLGVTDQTVRKWASRGWIPRLRAGKRPLMFHLDAVIQALESRGLAATK